MPQVYCHNHFHLLLSCDLYARFACHAAYEKCAGANDGS